MLPGEMYKAINKGVPNNIPIELDFDVLIESCANNSGSLLTSMRKIRNNYESTISCITGFNKSNHEFFHNLRLITNYKNSETNIYVSPNDFINRLKTVLGVTNPTLDIDDPELLLEFNSRLALLDSITDLDELMDKFPVIFEDYKYALTLSDEIRTLEQEKRTQSIIDRKRASFQRFGLDIRPKVFISNQKNMYHALVSNIKSITEFANTNPVTEDITSSLDKDKFELYVASQYLEYAKSTDDELNKQKAIYYLSTYFNENCSKEVDMVINHKYISNLSLLKEFRKLLKENKDLKIVNESREVYKDYHIKHVKNHVNKYMNSLDKWLILRLTQNELLANQKERITRLLHHHEGDGITEEEYNILSKYMNMFVRKTAFYENSGYIMRLFGVAGFEGHVAYIYPNGLVVIDKLYDESLLIEPTFNEAIYLMDINTFLNASTMDKPTFRANDNVKRIFHTKKWEERLAEEIQNSTLTLNKEDVKVLTNKYNPKTKTK